MICAICRSTDFEEDNQGFLYCIACGTQNEEIFAESFENEGASQSAAGRNIIKNYIKADKLAPVDSSPLEIRDVLLVFQKILKMYVDATVQISGVSSVQPLVKMLWFSFLRKWNQLGGGLLDAVVSSRLRTSDSMPDVAAVGVEVCASDSAECLPFAVLVPSRLLLLGLINLACRLSRSWVSPPDLINWCRQERVPYAQAYQLLPAEVKLRVTTNAKVQELFIREFSGKGSIHNITPSNILFYTFEIGKMLDIAVPALNAPLLARAMALSLGFPNSTVISYANVMQLLNSSVRTRKFRYLAEDVAASLCLACKLDPKWHERCLIRVCTSGGRGARCDVSSERTIESMKGGDTGGATACTRQDISARVDTLPGPLNGSADLISAHTLDTFLSQTYSSLRSTIDSKPSNSMGYASFNKIIKRTFMSQPELAGKGHSENTPNEFGGARQGRIPCDRRREVTRSHVDLVAPFRNEFDDYFKDTMKSQSKSLMAAYGSTAGVCNDQLGVSSVHHLVLLERIARHSQLSPALLNAIFDSDDVDCVNLAVDALTIFTKQAAKDMQVQRQKERSVFRIGSLFSNNSNTSTVIKDASKLNYMRQCYSMMKRLNKQEAPPIFNSTSSPLLESMESTAAKINTKTRKSTVPNAEKACKKMRVDVGGPHKFS